MSSRLETNFKRLLNRCENIAKDRNLWDWRLEKYTAALQDLLGELKKSTSKPAQEVLNNYSKKVDFLKGILEADKLSSASEKVLATDKLPQTILRGSDSNRSRELHLQTKSKYQTEMRDELLGTRIVNGDAGVRQRKGTEEEDIDSLIQHQRQMHEKLAEEMLNLTRNLKESVRDSGRIVSQDNKKLAESTKLADTNYGRLKVESERLEKHAQKCSWWIWIMLVLVTVTFLFMIVFMRLFGKKS